MALLMENEDGSIATPCALCDRQLTEPFFATSHFMTDESDELYEFSDAAMHWKCYAEWPHQRRFASLHFESCIAFSSENPYWAVVLQAEDFLVTANPSDDVADVTINLRMSGAGFRFPIAEWKKWIIDKGWRDACPHRIEYEAMDVVEEEIRKAIPDSAALIAMAVERLES